MNYKEAVTYILNVPKFTKKNKIENTIELMERLGRPERKLKIIHVAGTNGKGSVCAFLSTILSEAGKQTGLFTSPHLIKINERFQINQEPVTDDEFLEAYQKIDDVVKHMVSDGFAHPTYFELLFALGMVLFSEKKMEYAVVETGLGGRWDATNVIEHPIVTILTSISLEHTEILGDTIEKIAYEKAGILKPKVPVIYDGRRKEAEQVILAKAKELLCPAIGLYEEMYEVLGNTEKSIDFSLNYGYYVHTDVTIPYLADYQVINSALALMAMEFIDGKGSIPIEKRVKSIAKTKWQGRMETVLPGVVFDGAHNADGIRAFMKTVKKAAEQYQIVLLFSAVAEKDYEKMIRTLCEEVCFSTIVVTQIHNARMVSAKQLADIFRKYTTSDVLVVPKTKDAFERALREKKEGMLFCAGSLYLIGELKRLL